MKPTADFEDLHAQVTAHIFLINALLIAVMNKGALTKERRDGLIESSVASIDAAKDPFLAKPFPTSRSSERPVRRLTTPIAGSRRFL